MINTAYLLAMAIQQLTECNPRLSVYLPGIERCPVRWALKTRRHYKSENGMASQWSRGNHYGPRWPGSLLPSIGAARDEVNQSRTGTPLAALEAADALPLLSYQEYSGTGRVAALPIAIPC